jgi:quercetin dioxygenase-like cupin family protein
MLHKKSKTIQKSAVEQGNSTYRQVLISNDEAPNFALRKFTIEPGGSMPLHTNTVEHEQYVLSGSAEISIGGEIINAEKDDVIFIPKGIEHYYKNIGAEPFEFLCIVPNGDDIIEIKS